MGYWKNTATPQKATWANPQFTPEAQRQNGGWYYNPASGYVEQWWGDGQGPDAGQTVDQGGDARNIESPEFPSFNFNFEDEQKKAYESLKPFYEKIVEFAQGDLDLAKRVLQYTYDQGLRENKEEYDSSSAEAQRLAPEERSQLNTDQNRRGILESGFGKTAQNTLTERQSARADMIQKAYDNRESRLDKEFEFGSEQEERGFNKEKFDTERQRRQEAQGIATTKFGIDQSKYQVELNEAQRKEAERVRNLESQSQKDFYDQYGYGFEG